MNVLLLSTYELGHQPFGLASPKAWLEREGAVVRCVDLAVDELSEAEILAGSGPAVPTQRRRAQALSRQSRH